MAPLRRDRLSPICARTKGPAGCYPDAARETERVADTQPAHKGTRKALGGAVDERPVSAANRSGEHHACTAMASG